MLFNNTNMRTAMAYTNAVGDKVYPIIVDIKKGIKSTEEVSFVSSDINTGVLSVAFIQGNDTYNVEGAEVICSIMRPDTTTLEIPCDIVRDNVVDVPLGINGTSQDGVYSFDFKVFKGGNKIVGTPIMNYSVSLSISNDLVVEEDDRLPVLTMLITQVNELKEETRETINQSNVATEASREATANAIEATNNANAVSERVSQETATAISEIRQDTANAIASMNQSTSTAISTMNQSTTDAIASMTQKTDEAVTRINDNLANINNVVTTKVAELDNAKSDMTTTVSNKLNDVETRFNALTSSQQQSSEVIDARDGETSLKARLDRDIEKAKQVYVNVEGSNISTDSNVGYLKDVEILGNTIQDASNLADIRSVGDKVEGQELYEIPVVSYGKNLLKIPDSSGTSHGITFTSKDGLVTVNGTNTGYIGYDLVNGVVSDKLVSYSLVQSILDYYSGVPKFINKPGNYTIKVDSNIPLGELTFSVNVLYDDNKHLVRGNDGAGITNPFSISVDSHINGIYIGCWYSGKTFDNVKLKVQIEEGTQATPYEPYIEDKLTILSPVQLEKVGDVADRIIEKDGVWGVENNVIDYVPKINHASDIRTYNNVESSLYRGFFVYFDDVSITRFANKPNVISNYFNPCSDKYNITSGLINGCIGGFDHAASRYYIAFSILKSELSENTNIGAFEWFKNKEDLFFKIQLAQPQFIPLPHDQQIKLRAFANKTNISFLTEIEGTIKAQVPKSLGATVNTHTEQINNLNKELDRVKKLEESTVSTVTTESDFTTVEATSNGYFEDVKLEGKTLVNMYNNSYNYVTTGVGNYVKENNGVTVNNTSENGEYYILLNDSINVNPNTLYTLIIDIETSNNYQIYTWLDNSFKLFGDGNSNTKFAKTFTSGKESTKFRFDSDTLGGTVKFKNIIILEGDHTQNPPSYFEGLKSVGDTADEIVVSSVKGDGNLFDDSVLSFKLGANVRTDYIPFKLKHKEIGYMAFNEDLSPYISINFAFRLCDKNKKEIQWFGFSSNENNLLGKTCENFKEVEYIQLFTNGNMTDTHTISNFVITEDNTKLVKTYIPHQSDKKRLLYYNEETQTWEKPILREWDSIEKHANGKYYYHQRSAEVVLNGSENWYAPGWSTLESWISNNPNGFAYETHISITGKSCDTPVICNKFNSKSIPNSSSLSIGYCVLAENYLSFATNVQSTIDQWKSELQTNPVTVVYQLAQEKVYECTNIDLITYANETNYVVESGAITPKSILKVHSNISNVVKILQQKVSLLENKFIEGLKQVLAGDMYSLAELLYPEDFEEVETENSIMLLPLE